MTVDFLRLIGRYCFSILFVILTFCATTVLSQKINHAERFIRQSEQIQVSSTINGKKKCRNNSIVLDTTVVVKNLSENPIVFCKECITSGAIFVSKDVTSLSNEKFVYDLDSFGGGIKIKETNFSPNQKPFVTIFPQQEYSIPISAYLFSFDGKEILPNGKYVFVQVLETWSDFTSLGNELENKWKKEGLLFWNRNILTDSTILNLGKIKHSNCD